jgi:ABC-2 type transport system ATP-binding protein
VEAQPVIDVRNVSHRFGPIQALRDVTLAIPPGVIYGLIGPSGSGKTTLIRMLVGVLQPDGGTIRVLGHSLPDRSVAERTGYMTQSTALYPDLSLRENLAFFGALYGLDERELRRRIDEVAAEVELAGRLDGPLHTFSGGMQRRSSLACAMLHQPELLILDEPTVGLDPVLRRSFWARFRALAQAGRTLIVTSHIMDEAGRCDLLGFTRDGRLLASGSPDELRRLTGQAELEEAFLALAEQSPVAEDVP